MTVTDELTQSLHALFEGELRDVHFPGVDAASLQQHRAAVEAAADAVHAAELTLSQAVNQLQEHKQALARHTQRALAYARIYAEERPALAERLEVLSETLAGSRRKSNLESASGVAGTSRRRGRPRKLDTNESLVVTQVAEAADDIPMFEALPLAVGE